MLVLWEKVRLKLTQVAKARFQDQQNGGCSPRVQARYSSPNSEVSAPSRSSAAGTLAATSAPPLPPLPALSSPPPAAPKSMISKDLLVVDLQGDTGDLGLGFVGLYFDFQMSAPFCGGSCKFSTISLLAGKHGGRPKSKSMTRSPKH